MQFLLFIDTMSQRLEKAIADLRKCEKELNDANEELLAAQEPCDFFGIHLQENDDLWFLSKPYTYVASSRYHEADRRYIGAKLHLARVSVELEHSRRRPRE